MVGAGFSAAAGAGGGGGGRVGRKIVPQDHPIPGQASAINPQRERRRGGGVLRVEAINPISAAGGDGGHGAVGDPAEPVFLPRVEVMAHVARSEVRCGQALRDLAIMLDEPDDLVAA